MATAALLAGGGGAVGCGGSDDGAGTTSDSGPGSDATGSDATGMDAIGMDASSGHDGGSTMMDANVTNDGAGDAADTGDGGLAAMFRRDYFNDYVSAIVHSGSSWYLGGKFDRISTHLASKLAILDSTGNLGSCPFGSGFTDGQVSAVATVGNAIFAAGTFSTYQGVAAPYLVKIDATTCALDRTFTPLGTTGVNAPVNAVVVVGSELFIGGSFTTYRGATLNRVAKLSITDGSADATFSPAAGNGVSGYVDALASDGTSLYIGGIFAQSLHGTATTATNIAKVDLTTGAADTTFSPMTGANGFDGQVRALAVAGTSLYVGGSFSAYRGVSATDVAKLALANGALDTTFSPAGANGFNGPVGVLAVSSTSLYVGGDFTAYRGVAGSATDIAKLDLTNGSLDTAFSPPGANGFGNGSFVGALAISGTNLYAGGFFSSYRGVAGVVSSFAKMDALTGALDTSFQQAGSGASGFGGFGYGTASVSAIVPLGTSVLVGGNFSTYGGDVVHFIAKVDDTTFAVDTSFSPALENGFDGYVLALAATGTSIYAGGRFTAYRDVPTSAEHLAKLDATSGALDTTFSPPGANGFDNLVSALAVSGTSIYVGGQFTAYRGVTGSSKSLAKLDAVSGALDTTFSPSSTNGFDDSVAAFAVSGASIYVGGSFTAYRGVATSAEHLAKLDLTTGGIDTTFSPPTNSTSNGTGGVVNALAASDTSLYIGGDFAHYRGVAQAVGNIAKVDLASGVLDTTFCPSSIAPGFDQEVFGLSVANGSVYAGGVFTSYRSSSNGPFALAKLNATTGVADTTFSPPGVGMNGVGLSGGIVNASAVTVTVTNGMLLVGGTFNTYRGTSVAQGLAVLDPTSGTLN